MKYRSRVVDQELRTRLAATGAVVIEGPKACGKTVTARQVAASEVLLDIDQSAQQAVAVDPSLILEGRPTPLLIDEWQTAPAIWNHVRRAVDSRGQPGQFILTGSAVPANESTRHTGAGRITRLQMRPMSLFETGDSTGAISLRGLLQGEPARSPDPGLTVGRLAELISVGGWPANLGRTEEQAIQAARDYLEEVRRVDVQRVDDVRRDPRRVGRVIRTLARHSATYVSDRTIAADASGRNWSMDPHTVGDYVDALHRLMILEDQPPWAPHLRSRSRVRMMAKRHFVDPSLAVAALSASPMRLLMDLNLMGFLFESLVVRDLRVYAQAADAELLQYRDNTALEVDAIVEAKDGCWAGFEIKLGPGMVDQGAESLLRFAERVDTRKSGPPRALGVIVGSGFGYKRDDGVSVIPIGALGP